MGDVSKRLEAVRERIAAVCRSAGRSEGEVDLIAVSKRHPPEAIREAYAAGQRDFGENYAQELVTKAEALKDLADIRWHLIGHLQRNKVSRVVPHVAVLHTLDSARLVQTIDRLLEHDRKLPCLIQVNVGGEEQKAGCKPEEVAAVLDASRECSGVRARGLMCIPPLKDNPEDMRPCFRRLRELAESFELEELSMGMSHDYEIAIQEGATHIRVGAAIFGPRDDGVGVR